MVPQGNSLIKTPDETKVQGFPSLPMIALGSNPPPAAEKYPAAPSRMLVAAVQPSAARSAATTPFSAACPAVKGLLMVPKFSRTPLASAPTTPKAYSVSSTLRPRSLAQAAALANDP